MHLRGRTLLSMGKSHIEASALQTAIQSKNTHTQTNKQSQEVSDRYKIAGVISTWETATGESEVRVILGYVVRWRPVWAT